MKIAVLLGLCIVAAFFVYFIQDNSQSAPTSDAKITDKNELENQDSKNYEEKIKKTIIEKASHQSSLDPLIHVEQEEPSETYLESENVDGSVDNKPEEKLRQVALIHSKIIDHMVETGEQSSAIETRYKNPSRPLPETFFIDQLGGLFKGYLVMHGREDRTFQMSMLTDGTWIDSEGFIGSMKIETTDNGVPMSESNITGDFTKIIKDDGQGILFRSGRAYYEFASVDPKHILGHIWRKNRKGDFYLFAGFFLQKEQGLK